MFKSFDKKMCHFLKHRIFTINMNINMYKYVLLFPVAARSKA